MLVGHPGETEDDVNQLIEVVKEAKFERLGAFTYSEEEGTFAAKNYTDDVDPQDKSDRLDALMRVQERIASEINMAKIGQTCRVIIDKEEGDYYIGRTEFDSPEVDNEVLINNDVELEIGAFYNVKIVSADAFDLFGEVIG